MSMFAELKSKLWLDWEMCRNNALFKLPILMSLLCSFKRDVSPMHLSLQFLQGIQLTSASVNMLHWGLECTNSRIVLECKELVLILSLFKLFVMLWGEELFVKVMNLWRELVLSDIEWALGRGWFLLWILRALDLANCIKDLGYWRSRKEFSMWMNSSFKYF